MEDFPVKTVVSILTCLAVVYHLTVGCCGHHAHASTITRNSVMLCQHSQSKCHSHATECGHANAESQQSSKKVPTCPHEGCHESHCSVVLPSKSVIDDGMASDVSISLPTFDFPSRPIASQVSLAPFITSAAPIGPGQGSYLIYQRFLN